MVNANHARPLVAFWLLAVVAAVITVIGLLEGSPGAPVHTGSPARVTASGAPELVLGGVLRAQPDSGLGTPLSPDLWVPTSTSTGALPVSSPASAGTHKARAGSSTAHQTTTQQTGGKTHTHTTQTVATSTTTGTSGQGKGHQKSGSSKTTTTTTTATATTTTSGHGGGRPTDPGKGH